MKKKFLCFLSVICLMASCLFTFNACDTPETPNDPQGNVYTVTEAEWELNFDITKSKAQPGVQPLSCVAVDSKIQPLSSTTSLAEITSYTLRAEGTYVDYNGVTDDGVGLLKVAPNGMYMEFYINGVLQQVGPGGATTPSTDPWYVGMTTMLKSYFPFSGKYSEFTFNETTNTYVKHNLVSTVVDESDIAQTYELYNKTAEIKFVNGYLNTVYVELCEDNTFGDPYLTLTFTFTDINNTTVVL